MKAFPTTKPLTAYAKGVMGETAAQQYLEALGYRLLERRYHSPYGEADLVMLNDEILVVIEVKTREHERRLTAQYAVTPIKQQRLIQTAQCYLADHPEHIDRCIRFDVVAIGKDGLLHLPNAFEGRV